ncbi:hypothetical protein CEXT_285711 [Caerostris extrusa]|uniref:Uncharacterized protein n=1 Tax=Caerostris extrusa TaxID=172846 RepID=A0AAV4V0F6_CAEEX|nr:hypothetical protein CEXT_285711 [Caerostris extrusa]
MSSSVAGWLHSRPDRKGLVWMDIELRIAKSVAFQKMMTYGQRPFGKNKSKAEKANLHLLHHSFGALCLDGNCPPTISVKKKTTSSRCGKRNINTISAFIRPWESLREKMFFPSPDELC